MKFIQVDGCQLFDFFKIMSNYPQSTAIDHKHLFPVSYKLPNLMSSMMTSWEVWPTSKWPAIELWNFWKRCWSSVSSVFKCLHWVNYVLPFSSTKPISSDLISFSSNQEMWMIVPSRNRCFLSEGILSKIVF